MSGALDATARALATRMLEKYGAPAVVAFVAANGLETFEPCSSVRNFHLRVGSGSVGMGARDQSIADADEVIFVDAAPLSRAPAHGDRLNVGGAIVSGAIVGGVNYAVIRNIDLWPGVLPILYALQVAA